jgi:predicted  nucleic acid-binding Zn-ribbon protein
MYHGDMPHLDNLILERTIYIAAAMLLLYLGYRIGKMLGILASTKLIETKEQELFTAQRGFKTLYENELSTIKAENDGLKQQVQAMTVKVEEYRKKAAGLGGLFSSGGKKADAMYALLLENEALEEALYNQNEKLKQERTDALKEQIRNTGYRRVLMSQLLSDDRIKGYVAEVLADEKRLPGVGDAKALPAEADHHG